MCVLRLSPPHRIGEITMKAHIPLLRKLLLEMKVSLQCLINWLGRPAKKSAEYYGHRSPTPLHQGQLRSVVGNSPIMGGDPTIGGNPTTGWYSTQHLVGILTIFTIDAI